MAKKKMNKNKKITDNKKVMNSISSSVEVSQVIKCIVVVAIVFALTYLLTIYITKNSTDSVTKVKKETTTIQYDEILAGTSFSQKDKEYLVLFYNVKEDTDSIYYTLKSEYKSKEEKLPIYYVDLSSALNSSCINEESNENAMSAKELKINGPTLIKFVNGTIEEYITGEEEITTYLK